MNNGIEGKEIDPIFAQAADLISKIEKERKSSTVISLICFDRSLTYTVAYTLNKMLRKIGDVQCLDLLLESGGGDIDAAAKIVKLCRAHCKKFSVMVPFTAKSAATLIAICADEIVMTKSAELGPVDPQVHHPALDLWIPAHSIKDALSFIESTHDPFVKLTMADKLDPLLIGAFEDAQNATVQYIAEAFTYIKDNNKRKNVVEIFTTRYKSHGYPIDRILCSKEAGIRVIYPEEGLEKALGDLHELYFDKFLTEGVKKTLIIQTANELQATMDKEIISASLKRNKPSKKKIGPETSPKCK